MKPDDIPEVIWEEALSLHRGCAMDPRRSAAIPIARAILQARAQAYAECAKMAEKFGGGGDPYSDFYDGFYCASRDISQAIRQHSQKERVE